MRKISITGPESTGKSHLSKELANALGGIVVGEYARQFLDERGGKYDRSDLLEIAMGQCKLEDEASQGPSSLLMCDTDLVVIKIWSLEKYGTCDPWIEKEVASRTYDHTLLCYPDLLWEPDPLRENPDDRMRLFNLYQRELDALGRPFSVVKGTGSDRLDNALNIVSKI